MMRLKTEIRLKICETLLNFPIIDVMAVVVAAVVHVEKGECFIATTNKILIGVYMMAT